MMGAAPTVAELAQLPRWVAWRGEERNGKLTKVPYSPLSGLQAKSDDPSTWHTRSDAQACAQRIANGHGGGVGLMLGPIDDEHAIGGVDLDTCRAADGMIEPWAAEVIEGIGSYAETSPSGTGIKALFLYRLAELPRLREAMGTQHGKMWKRDGGEHPPSIELHISNRYFAVTGEHCPETPAELRDVSLDVMLWLVREAGPTFANDGPRGPAEDGASGSNDQSRSAKAFRLACKLAREGCDRSIIERILARDPESKEWVAEKGRANGGRELDRLLDKALTAAGEPPPDPKRPLFRPLAAAPEFPITALGELRLAAEAIAETVRAPIGICAQAALATSTLAIQAHRDVELPGAGRRPLTGLFISVAESGDRKSSVDRLALAPVHAREAAWRAGDREARLAHKNAREAWELGRDEAKKAAKKGGAQAVRDALDRCGSEPKPPPHPMLLVADPTPEALVLHLAEGRPWGGLFSSEAGLVIGGAAFSDDSRMRTGALLNCLWDGEPIRRKRVTTGSHFLPGRRCSVHLMMQPSVAPRLFADPILSGIGVLARVLLVAPESLAGTRLWRKPLGSTEAALQDYSARLTAFLSRAPRCDANDPDVLDPVPMMLHPDAEQMFIAFHDACEKAQRPEGSLAAIRSFASKMPEHAGRLAAILTCYADPSALVVTPEAMAGGIDLAQHYAAELLRLAESAALAPDLHLASRLLAWWQARPDARCHLAAIYQYGPPAIRDAAIARRIVAILEDHGWVRRLRSGIVLDGAPKRDAWSLMP